MKNQAQTLTRGARSLTAAVGSRASLGANIPTIEQPPIPISEVRSEVNRMRQEIEYARNAFADLAQRLGEGGVLTIPADNGSGPDEPSPISPLANELRGISYGVEQLVRDINQVRGSLAI